jgi:hypothetical protein
MRPSDVHGDNPCQIRHHFSSRAACFGPDTLARTLGLQTFGPQRVEPLVTN